MSILRNHHCGHVQRICPRCLSIGCGYSNCPECIGNNSAMVCKACGDTNVLSMENYQNRKQARARENVREQRSNEIRIKNLEKASKIRYVGGYEGNAYSGFPNPFTIRNFIIIVICYVLSYFLHYKDFTGIPAFFVGIINIIGAIADLLIKFILSFVG